MSYIPLIVLSVLVVLTFIGARRLYLKLENEHGIIEGLTEENKNVFERNRKRKIEIAEIAAAIFLKINDVNLD